MSSAVFEDRVSDLWNRAVDLGRRGKFPETLDAWIKVRRFDDDHRVLDDRERARLHLFLGNAHLVNGNLQEASDEYGHAADIFQQREPDESSVQWIEETFHKWKSALCQAREKGKPVHFDERLFASFRETVPSYKASQRVHETYDEVSVQAMHGRWVIRFASGATAWEFHGSKFEQALQKAKRGAMADSVDGEWGPGTESYPLFPG